VTGREQLPVETAATRARLDLEVLQRWIRFLAKEPKHYPFVVPWQEMIADEGGTEEKAQELADTFQRLVLEIVGEQDELEERNRRIIAKGTPLEEVKSTPMPNGFESFFDQHQLELDTMERERFNLFVDLFYSDLDNELDTFFRQPGVFRFQGWGLERQLSRVADDHVTSMREEIEKLEEELPDIPFVMGVAERDSADLVDIPLHIRGSPKNLGEPVPSGFPIVLEDGAAEPYDGGSGRLQLAEDIAEHPLAARVIVNRVWAWHMGAGIVRSPSNFGFAGEPPTNPELLEYLASDFVANGRSIKGLHRMIMSSAVYQLATTEDPRYRDVDPENRHFWRFNRQRLTAESIRDALLHVAGTLDAEVGGPSLQLDDDENDRRTLYAEVSRFQLHEYLQTFDFPNPSLTAERRFATNVPLQSLYFMNSDFVRRQADAFVRRLATLADGADSTATPADTAASTTRPARSTTPKGRAAEDGDDEDEEEKEPPARFDDRVMIEAAYPLLYGRPATPEEVELGLAFLGQQRTAHLEEEMKKEAEERKAGEEGAAAAGAAPAGDSRAAASRPATPEPTAAAAAPVQDEPTADTSKAEADRELAARRASLAAWVQYARALFSAAELRFID
jgi:hypothetical protein